MGDKVKVVLLFLIFVDVDSKLQLFNFGSLI